LTWRAGEQGGIFLWRGDDQRRQLRRDGACAAAICTPPIGLGLATLIQRKLWSDEQRESGLAASAWDDRDYRRAIPFAAGTSAGDPSIMLGSMVAAMAAMVARG